jgi:Tol biopolymer transport system component
MIAADNQRKDVFTIDDAFAIRNFSGIKLSPDASEVVCVSTVTDLHLNSREDHVALISASSKQLNLITKGSNPLWSPDGLQIAYYGSENGQSGSENFSLAYTSLPILSIISVRTISYGHLMAGT